MQAEERVEEETEWTKCEMNAYNDKHLRDSVARVSHAVGESFCMETHLCTVGNVSHHKSTNAHRYLFIVKYKGRFSLFFTAVKEKRIFNCLIKMK